MFEYNDGVLLSLLLWIYNVINSLYWINSRMENNFNKVGLRLSWLTLDPKPMEPSDINKPAYKQISKFILIHFFNFLFIFTSWLYLFAALGLTIHGMSKKWGMPQALKEYRWKMRNIDMPPDQIIKEVMKLNANDLDDFEEFKNNMRDDFNERGLDIRI